MASFACTGCHGWADEGPGSRFDPKSGPHPPGVLARHSLHAQVEGYGELMDDWIQNRVKQLNEVNPKP